MSRLDKKLEKLFKNVVKVKNQVVRENILNAVSDICKEFNVNLWN